MGFGSRLLVLEVLFWSLNVLALSLNAMPSKLDIFDAFPVTLPTMQAGSYQL